MKEKFKENKITLIEVDVDHVEGIWTYLKKEFNRSNIPVNLMYPADASLRPIILGETLSQSIILKAIEAASAY